MHFYIKKHSADLQEHCLYVFKSNTAAIAVSQAYFSFKKKKRERERERENG